MSLARAVRNLEQQFGRRHIDEPLLTPEEAADAQAIIERILADPVGNASAMQTLQNILDDERAAQESAHA